jgi:transcriptional regulator
MYIPKYFKNENAEEISSFIKENGFGILISQLAGKLLATHIPLMLDKAANGSDILMGHISKANPQWKNFEQNEEVLAIFSGPHAYISSSWYDHENVPTWNYIAVHVYGKIRILEAAALKQQLSKLVDKYEAGRENPVRVENMSAAMLESQMRGIVGFEIEISDIQAVKKLSQNRDAENYARIVDKLEESGEAGAAEIVRKMNRAKRAL